MRLTAIKFGQDYLIRKSSSAVKPACRGAGGFPPYKTVVRCEVVLATRKGHVMTVREGREWDENQVAQPIEIYEEVRLSQVVRPAEGPRPDYFNQKPITLRKAPSNAT